MDVTLLRAARRPLWCAMMITRVLQVDLSLLCAIVACSVLPLGLHDFFDVVPDLFYTDSCDKTLGCQYQNISCDDTNACTTDGCSAASGCTHTTISCNDNNACTTDGCSMTTGCTHSNVTCNSASACIIDGCNAASGCTTTAVVCNDNNACTAGRVQCDICVCLFVSARELYCWSHLQRIVYDALRRCCSRFICLQILVIWCKDANTKTSAVMTVMRARPMAVPLFQAVLIPRFPVTIITPAQLTDVV